MRLAADFEIVNVRGLHARASARFVAVVELFDARVWVSRDNLRVNGDSIMGLLLLAAGMGSSIHVETEGPQAEAALAAIGELIAARFDESD